jgi:SAM-dependent methyltransferase
VTGRTRGSPEAFEHFWATAVERDYTYPRAVPRTQGDLFEREKARLIDGFLRTLGVTGGRVLEYGCGSAGISVYMANQGFDAVAADLSRQALAGARVNWRLNGLQEPPKVFTTVAADAFRLPFRDAAFAVAMSYGLLEHFDRDALARSMAEAGRILRPGGVIMGDIVHGRFSARTVGNWLSFAALSLYRVLRGQWRRVRPLYGACFESLYENDLGPRDWEDCLKGSGFEDVILLSIRPFPPLAIAGRLDQLYVRFMERALRLYRWFDRSQSWLARRWGWTYLFRAVKPVTE